MDELSASYGKTAEALAAGRSATALAEYKQHFLPAVQRMYTSIVSIPPDRYAKAADWATWSRQFYILSVKAGKALQAKPAAQKREALDALRTHFRQLHRAVDCAMANDVIHDFYLETLKHSPSAEALDSLRQDLEKAAPSRKMKSDPQAYEKARQHWLKAIDPILKDRKVGRLFERRKLRQATALFHSSYGITFE